LRWNDEVGARGNDGREQEPVPAFAGMTAINRATWPSPLAPIPTPDQKHFEGRLFPRKRGKGEKPLALGPRSLLPYPRAMGFRLIYGNDADALLERLA
jgi:hypothetical protein